MPDDGGKPSPFNAGSNPVSAQADKRNGNAKHAGCLKQKELISPLTKDEKSKQHCLPGGFFSQAMPALPVVR